MSGKKTIHSNKLYAIIIIYTSISYLGLALSDELVGILIREDQIFESIGAVAFLTTSILFFISSVRTGKSGRYTKNPRLTKGIILGLALLFLFAAGEEISWGQRLFHIATPDWLVEINVQDEITLHNLAVIDAHFFDANRLFDIFWFTFTLVVPLTCVWIQPFGQFVAARMPIVPWTLGLLFFFNFIWAKIVKWLLIDIYTFDQVPFVQAVQEIKESNYALLFVLVGLYFVYDFDK